MRTAFTDVGWDDYTHWARTDRATLQRINRLLDVVTPTPFEGIGKPEALRHQLSGY